MEVKIRGVGDVAEFIDARPGIRGRASIIWWLLLGGLFLEALANVAMSAGLDPMTDDLSLSAGQVAMLTSLSSWVALLFNPIGGAIADRIGRVPPLIAAKALAVLGAVLACTAAGVFQVAFGRVFVGMAYGIDFAIAMAMLAEFTPRKFSARLNTWQGIWYTAVSLNLIFAIVFFQMGTGDSIWRYLLGTCGVVALVLLILQSCYLVESPTWQARKNRLAGAARSMSKIYGQRFVAAESPIGELQGPPTANRGLKNLKLIFRGRYLPRTILAATVQLVQSIQYFGVGWYLPIIAVALFGSDFIFNTVGTLVFNVFGIIGGFASAWLSAKIGQRIASKWGFLIVFIVLVIFGFAYDSLPLWLGFALPSLFILCHSIGPAANGKSLSSLSFRSEIRATANGFIGAIGSFGAALGLLIFPLLQEAFGLGPTFLIVAVFPLAAFIVCSVISWEPTRAEVHVDEETDAPQFV
ncbi:MFS transporter [Brevibacterium sp. FAM 27836]|uniref:MFS transporter n=1 Tax=Brevibacterium sp. FAM 27836 TaxID=3446693 RepID=UPI003F514CA3